MKVLVTGSEGFIGSHLTEALAESGADVRCLVLYNSFGSNGWLESLDEEVYRSLEIVKGDVRDSSLTDNLVKGVDAVFHLAALIAVPYSYIAAESFIDTNVKGTLNVLNSCRRHETGRVMVTSTSEVYGTAKYVPIDELHPRQGQSPYAASKISADALTESYYRSYGLPVTIVRPFNTYGPRQSARAVIADVIMQVISGSGKLRLGNVLPTRDMVYVKDTARGIIEAQKCEALIGEEVNIATGTEAGILDIAKMICALCGADPEIEIEDVRVRRGGSEVERLLGSSAKLEQFTGWKPATNLNEGLKVTIDWFRENLNNIRRRNTGFQL